MNNTINNIKPIMTKKGTNGWIVEWKIQEREGEGWEEQFMTTDELIEELKGGKE